MTTHTCDQFRQYQHMPFNCDYHQDLFGAEKYVPIYHGDNVGVWQLPMAVYDDILPICANSNYTTNPTGSYLHPGGGWYTGVTYLPPTNSETNDVDNAADILMRMYTDGISQ